MPRDLVRLSSRAGRADRGTNGFAHGVTGITDMSAMQKALPRDDVKAALCVRAPRVEAGDRDKKQGPCWGLALPCHLAQVPVERSRASPPHRTLLRAAAVGAPSHPAAPVFILGPCGQFPLFHTGGRDGQIQPDLLFFTLVPPAYTLSHQNHAKMRAQGTANTRLTASAQGSQENTSKFMDAEEA